MKACFTVWTEVTTRCNLACAYCAHQHVALRGWRRHKDMPFGTFEKIVADLAAFPRPLKIVFAGLGETLLYSDLLPALKLVRALHPPVHVHLATNAHLLKGRLAEQLLEVGLDSIAFGVNMATDSLYTEYKGAVSSVAMNIRNFLMRRGRRLPDVILRVNKFDMNLPYLPVFEKHWRPLLEANDCVSLGNFMNWAGTIPRDAFTTAALPSRVSCKFLHNRLTVTTDGAVFPCCAGMAVSAKDSVLRLGDVPADPLWSLYQSARLEHLRELHRQRQYPTPCDVCDAWWI